MFDQVRAAWLKRKAKKINDGRVTAADQLRRLGFTEAEVVKLRSSYGTQSRKAYERTFGAKPPKTGAEVVKMGKKSRLVATYAYRWDELSVLNQAALVHTPVAKILGW